VSKTYNVNVRFMGARSYQVIADSEREACDAAETLARAELHFGYGDTDFEVIDRDIETDIDSDGPYEASKVFETMNELGHGGVWNKMMKEKT